MKKRFILMVAIFFMSIYMADSASACTCKQVVNNYYVVDVDDCMYGSPPGFSICETLYGTNTGRCSCVPDCITGDGYCASYSQYYGDDLFTCDENTVNTPQDCCPSGMGDCDGDGTCEADLQSTSTCGSCMRNCNPETCESGTCVSTGTCGDGIVDAGEECDSDPLICNSYGGSCTYCDSGCKLITKTEEYCGDGILNGPEVCDRGNSNTDACDAYGQSCNYCSLTCENKTLANQWCGDDLCNGPENSGNCFMDCDERIGWNTTGDAFNMTQAGYLISTKSGMIFSRPFDIQTGKSYNLSADIISSGCTAQISLDNTCLSPQGFVRKDCGISSGAIPQGERSKIFTLTPNNHATNGYYFRDVMIKITTTCSSGNVIIGNISLKEDKGDVDFSVSPGISDVTGCCPLKYCWDGAKCVNSDDFMADSTKRPVWNNLSKIPDWKYNHINTTSQSIAKGFRCTVADNATGKADWAVSSIKYDWNYEQSGYCARESDCFVSPGFDAGIGNYSKGCVRDLDSVSDDKVRNKGNHLCYNGQWTTKSYMIATVLQNISVQAAKPYILQCYDDNSMNYNMPFATQQILSSCVITIQSPTSEQVITGVILKGNPDDRQNFLDALKSNYKDMFGASDSDVKLTEPRCYAKESQALPGTNFAACFDNVANLYVVYNKRYDYFLVSDRTITGLNEPNFLQTIIGFFKGLFAGRATNINAYTTIDHTTSYDRMYVLRNSTLNVTAMEEMKYDEDTMKNMTVIYVRYTGSNEADNPIHIAELAGKINETMIRTYHAQPIITYTNTTAYQELIIKTEEHTDAWRTLVTILRDRK